MKIEEYKKLDCCLQEYIKTTAGKRFIPIPSPLLPILLEYNSAQYLLGHDDIKTNLDTYTHFGYADVKVDKLESYYNAVKQ
ncbi:MAG: hypothetical protein E7247_10955 [Paenibacillaceae bacterium]|nr:hypothetical protein [Paenibacillaceae bacterium]